MTGLALTALLATLASADPDGFQDGHEGRAGRARAAHHGHGAVQRERSASALAPGSDPSVLPGDVLIADRANDRLLMVTPQGRTVWEYPRPGARLRVPDDAFFTPTGRDIVATQEDNYVVSVINFAHRRLDYRYGRPGVPGSGPNRLYNPDDAMLTRSGLLFSADIKNCRLVVIRPPRHRLARELGVPGECVHDPPRSYASPNGVFPRIGGGVVVTEITGDWVDVLDASGRLVASTHAPGFTYPSDTNMVSPGVLLSVDYTSPGAVETFTPDGRVLWRYAPRSGPAALRKPSLALPLPNGDILLNDDYNDRVIVIDPRTNRIVWQYGHKGEPGRRTGFLRTPDGVDLAPPHSLAGRFPQLAPPG